MRCFRFLSSCAAQHLCLGCSASPTTMCLVIIIRRQWHAHQRRSAAPVLSLTSCNRATRQFDAREVRRRGQAGSAVAVWAVFLALTALHIFANIRAVRALEVRTLNAARLEGLLAHYAATVSASAAMLAALSRRKLVAQQ